MSADIFLVCNAHIDIAWLWSWEEGVTEALATFRTAVRFCREYEGFVFNHNEAILYEWIAEYEPSLFEEIKDLVKAGKWNIIGGWYLQPDCNMPSGESFVRQILKGRLFFLKHFGVNPTTATNFDPFGHTRGLVQIMRKSGYDSYVVCRPGQKDFPLEDNDFLWVGYDGSEIMVHRVLNGYSSGKGKIEDRILTFLEKNPGDGQRLLLWGVGNHGGGPSKADLDKIEIMKGKGYRLKHTTPEAYFQAVKSSGRPLQRIEKSMQHWGVGCYTSSIRIKEAHRRLESDYFLTEKMASHGAAIGRLEYPKEALGEALRDLLYLQFHDFLPGSGIKRVEEEALRLADHGLEILSRLKLKVFLSMIQGKPHQTKEDGSYRTPIYLYNPHPFEVEDVFEYELALQDTIREGFGRCVLENEQGLVEVQNEREENNVPIQWRKRMAFRTRLKPCSMQRLDFHTVTQEKQDSNQEIDFTLPFLTLETPQLKLVINNQTGLVESYQADGREYLKAGSFLPMVFEDVQDSWGMTKSTYHQWAGSFKLYRDETGHPALRIIEDGPVRTIVEGVFAYGRSTLVMRYQVPKKGSQVEIQIQLKFAEERKGIKLRIHTLYEQASYLGDTAFGTEELVKGGQEVIAQKWVAVTDGSTMVTLINDSIYGSSYEDGSFYPTLIKSCGYAAHPMPGKVHMPDDRWIDCTEHISKTYKFYLNAGEMGERMDEIGREAQIKHERPYILNGFTDMDPAADLPFLELEDSRILCSAVKYSEDSTGLIIRLFNPVGKRIDTAVSSLVYKYGFRAVFQPYEIKSYKYEFEQSKWTEVTLLEENMEEVLQ